MALPPLVVAALDRLRSFYNGGVWVPASANNPGNPGGFDGDGHTINFVPALRDVATASSGALDATTAALAEIARTADEAKLAVLIVEGGPVSSVTVGGVTQTGAVTIDLSSISEPVQAQLAEIQAAQAALEASTSALSSDAAAYANAFGG